jgi:mono/diheme cytochrome c family protein
MRKAALVFLLAAASLGAQAQVDVPGRTLYNGYCAACHGLEGRGSGWMSQYLVRQSPALNALSRQYGGRFPEELVRYVIDGRRQVRLHGPRDMPIWGYVFQAEFGPPDGAPRADPIIVSERVGRLVEYLKEIQE